MQKESVNKLKTGRYRGVNMRDAIDGKIVVITGVSSGLGEATARHLSEQGASVVLGARPNEILFWPTAQEL